jgi:cell division protein ZapA
MSQVTVRINSRNYQVSCKDGQEDHVAKLAGYIDQKVGELVGSVGQVGEARLLVMSSLLIADEMAELYDELQELRGEAGGSEIPDPAAARARTDGETTARLEALARRIDAVSGALDKR